MRDKGTLNNFRADGALSEQDFSSILRTGKIAGGRERTQMIDRDQFEKWGIKLRDGSAKTSPKSKSKLE